MEVSTSETEEEANQAGHRESIVHEAVSRVVSDIMPGMDTMTTVNESPRTPGWFEIKTES